MSYIRRKETQQEQKFNKNGDDIHSVKTIKRFQKEIIKEILHMKRKFKSGDNYLVLYDCGTAFLRYGDSLPLNAIITKVETS